MAKATTAAPRSSTHLVTGIRLFSIEVTSRAGLAPRTGTDISLTFRADYGPDAGRTEVAPWDAPDARIGRRSEADS